MRKHILLCTCLLIAAAIHALAQTTAKPEPNSAEQTVLKLTQEWLDAEDRADRAALSRIIADDFLGTGPVGTTVSKTDVIPQEGAAHGLAISGQDIKVRLFGDTAIVTGRGIPKAQGRPELRFTVIFVKRPVGWQMVAGHLSMVPQE